MRPFFPENSFFDVSAQLSNPILVVFIWFVRVCVQIFESLRWFMHFGCIRFPVTDCCCYSEQLFAYFHAGPPTAVFGVSSRARVWKCAVPEYPRTLDLHFVLFVCAVCARMLRICCRPSIRVAEAHETRSISQRFSLLLSFLFGRCIFHGFLLRQTYVVL